MDAKQNSNNWQAVLQNICGNCKKNAPLLRVALQETGLHAAHAMAPSVARETDTESVAGKQLQTKYKNARVTTVAWCNGDGGIAMQLEALQHGAYRQLDVVALCHRQGPQRERQEIVEVP